jgi:hypothetical protein
MTNNSTVSLLRRRMIEDMTARQLGPHSQRSHIYSCKRFAAFLKRSPAMRTAARSFIPLWLLAAAVNMYIGVTQAGYTVAQELPIFGVIFAVPAAVAYMLSGWLVRK